ncbi:Protein of unknown function (DUF1016), partial [Candidatus Methanomarinus sp.]
MSDGFYSVKGTGRGTSCTRADCKVVGGGGVIVNSDKNKLSEMIPFVDSTYQSIRDILGKARSAVYRSINFTMVLAYWNIGKVIVDDEQHGKERAEYGKALIKELSLRLTKEYGKGFDESNLRNIRKFYLTFPNCDALRHE